MNVSCHFLIHITPVRPAPAFVAAPFINTCGCRGSGFVAAGGGCCSFTSLLGGPPKPSPATRWRWRVVTAPERTASASGITPTPPQDGKEARGVPFFALHSRTTVQSLQRRAVCRDAGIRTAGSRTLSLGGLLRSPQTHTCPHFTDGDAEPQLGRARQRPAGRLRLPATVWGFLTPASPAAGRAEDVHRLGQIPGRRGALAVL
ncbi:hypothetical protein AAY473_022708 [Plecturocebus cupreus]